jgi:hypothetical protein
MIFEKLVDMFGRKKGMVSTSEVRQAKANLFGAAKRAVDATVKSHEPSCKLDDATEHLVKVTAEIIRRQRERDFSQGLDGPSRQGTHQ